MEKILNYNLYIMETMERKYSLLAFSRNCTEHVAMGAGSALIYTIKTCKFDENNMKMSYDSENKSMLFLLLSHVLKFKLHLMDL